MTTDLLSKMRVLISRSARPRCNSALPSYNASTKAMLRREGEEPPTRLV